MNMISTSRSNLALDIIMAAVIETIGSFFIAFLLRPYSDFNQLVLFGCLLIIGFANALIICLDNWAMKGLDKNIDKQPFKICGSRIGLIYLITGIIFMITAYTNILSSLDIKI